MRLALFTPYGAMQREAGMVALLANYLQKSGAEAVQLRCDGAQRACARDALSAGGRTPFTCSPCIAEQSALAQWGGIKAKGISSFVAAEDVERITAWLDSVPGDQLFRSEFRGASLWDACRHSFLFRWQLAGGEELSALQQENLRGLFISYMHVRIAAERFIAAMKPSLHFVAGPDDAAVQAYLAEAKAAGAEGAMFSFNSDDETVVVEQLASAQRYETRLVLEGVASMRSDPRTWAPEVTAVVHEILSFLGYAPDRVI